jgi:hypothetical protein
MASKIRSGGSLAVPSACQVFGTMVGANTWRGEFKKWIHFGFHDATQ